MRTPVALFLVLAALAGCLSGSSNEDEDGSDEELPHIQVADFPVSLDHDHADASLHEAAAGLERVGHVPAAADGPPQQVYNLALGTDLLVASLGSITEQGALAPAITLLVLDASSVEDPQPVSSLAVPGGGVEAIAITPDDRFAFLGAEFSGAVGIWAVDLTDPTAPMLAGFTPMPLEGPHNVRYAEVGGRDLILASVSHVSTAANSAGLPQDSNPLQDLRVDIYEFDAAAPEVPMQLLSSYAAAGTDGLPQGTPIVHDAVVQRHPFTGQHIMYVAHWDEGVRLVDISDPLAPVEIGVYADPFPTSFLTIHTVKPHPGLINGRHVTVATAQCAYSPSELCVVRILDTTDPSRPHQVGTWTLPEEVRGNIYTTEIFDLADGRLVQPWGHAGVWALDLACDGCLAEPQVLGYHFLGDVEPALAGDAPFANAAIVRGHIAYVADVPGGIHVLRVP